MNHATTISRAVVRGALAALLLVGGGSAWAWSDVDISFELNGVDSVNWTRHNERCVHKDSVSCHHVDGTPPGLPCFDGDTLHVSFDKTGGSCSGVDNRHANFRFTDGTTNDPICEIEVQRHSGGDYDMKLITDEAGYTCSGRILPTGLQFRINSN